MKFPIFFFSIFLILFKNIIPKENETIIFAWQINRHGARAPYLGVKNGLDAYKEKWTQIEELSEVGKRMLYLLGVKARKRYMDDYELLSKEYNPQEVYIRSTDVNRTIESIECFLQGFYPNGTGPTIKDKVVNDTKIVYPPNIKYKDNFSEILEEYNLINDNSALPYRMSLQPVHLFYKPDHEFGLYDTNLCTGHKEIYEKQKKRKEIQDLGDELVRKFDFFNKLENNSDSKFMRDYNTLYKYMDGFVCDYTDQRKFEYLINNFKFSEENKTLLKEYSDKYLLMDYFETNYPDNHPEIPIMSNSYTLHSIINWMEKAINGTKDNQSYIKYVIYSAHDASIGALEHYMKYVFNITPKYSTFAETRFFELYYENENKNEPKVRYINGNEDEIILINFSEFKSIIENNTWTDEEVAKYCHFEIKKEEDNDNNDDSEKHTAIAAMVILSIINLILILVLIIQCIKK